MTSPTQLYHLSAEQKLIGVAYWLLDPADVADVTWIVEVCECAVERVLL
jgi:hypothetical protein